MKLLRSSTLSKFDIIKKKKELCQKANVKLLEENFGKIVKKSKYNYEKKYGNYLFIWNTLSDACVLLNDEETQIYYSLDNKEIKTSFISNLFNEGILIERDKDEQFVVDLIRKRNSYYYPEDGNIGVVIIPTLACNANCFYCFQNEEMITMKEDTIKAVIQYITQRATKESEINYLWFGGEPLLAAEIIGKIIVGVKQAFNNQIKYTSSIITNGSLITEEMISIFKNIWNVNDILITLDGYQNRHNMRKDYKDSSLNAYEETLNRISLLINNSIKTTCRINLDKENIYDIDCILDDLKKFEDSDYFNVQITTLRGTENTEKNDNRYYRVDEYSEFYKNIMPKLFKNFIKKPIDYLPSRKSSYCIACSMNKILINADGKLFKCMQEMYSDENSVGDCIHGVINNGSFAKWFSKIDKLDDKCNNCIFMPCCQGGCIFYNLHKTNYSTNCNRNIFYIDLIIDEIVKEVEGTGNNVFSDT